MLKSNLVVIYYWHNHVNLGHEQVENKENICNTIMVISLTHWGRVTHTCVGILWHNLFGGKPLSESMLEYCQLDPWEQMSVKFIRNLNISFQENDFENVIAKSRPCCLGINVLKISLWSNQVSHLVITALAPYNPRPTGDTMVIKSMYIFIHTPLH